MFNPYNTRTLYSICLTTHHTPNQDYRIFNLHPSLNIQTNPNSKNQLQSNTAPPFLAISKRVHPYTHSQTKVNILTKHSQEQTLINHKFKHDHCTSLTSNSLRFLMTMSYMCMDLSLLKSLGREMRSTVDLLWNCRRSGSS